MKFSIDRDVFSEVLQKIQGVCSQRTTFAILGSCMIEVEEDKITVLGTDLDIAIRISCPAQVAETGVVVLSAQKLHQTVRSLQPGPLTLSSEGNQVTLQSGSSLFRPLSSNVEDFPTLPTMALEESHTLSSAVLADMIAKTKFSISSDESRVDFNGALLVLHKEGKVQMVSTDGHRLSRVESTLTVEDNVDEALERGVIIPKKGLHELERIIGDGDVRVGLNKEMFVVTGDNYSVSIQLIPGRFPDFTKVIPRNLEHKAIVDRQEFLQKLRSASTYTSKVGTIRLTLEKGRMDIRAFDSEAGDAHVDLACDYAGSGVTAGFNWKYIEDVLKVIDGDKVSVEIIDTDNPSLFRDVDSNSMDFIVMPMQL